LVARTVSCRRPGCALNQLPMIVSVPPVVFKSGGNG